MKFKIDENLPVEVANLLTEQGHDALTVFQEHLDGAPDSYISIVCRREKRALITLEPLAETKKFLNYFDQQRNTYGKEAVSMIYLTN